MGVKVYVVQQGNGIIGYCYCSSSIRSIDGCLRKLMRLCPSHSKFSGSSFRLKCCSRRCWKAPHLAMMCQGVSSSSLQCLQRGSGLFPGSSRLLCLLRKQCPVSQRTALPQVFLAHFMICFEILMLGFWKNSFVCLQALLLSHLAVQWKSINFLISFLKKVVGRGSHGSGPGELRRAPFLASRSALSLPCMPQ